jgi:hypothetical protein
MMALVMILRGDAFGRPTGHDGEYLRDFDFEAYGGVGLIDVTPDITKAKQFADLAEALEFRNRQPRCAPTREDGKPNRPLSATTWEFKPL